MFNKNTFLQALLPLVFFSSITIASKIISPSWLSEKHQRYTIYFTTEDSSDIKDYCRLVDEGIYNAQLFFNSRLKNDFEVYVHPNRNSLDQQWQKDWKMPEFKSECWMVASGIATKLDMIAPKKWDKESCEHKYVDIKQTRQLIMHEIIHVFHGQLNPSPDFSKVNNLDWFVEGLATYASGQCDSTRMADVRKALANNEVPEKLDNFWTGKNKYGLSGSVVMYMDKKLGREKIKELLKLTKSSELFKSIRIKEADLITVWKKYMTNAAGTGVSK